MKQADKQWCLETAIELMKARAESNAQVYIATELEEVYKKLKELGEDAWGGRD